MNGPSHYVKGEELAEHAEDLIKQGDPDGLAPVWAALAHVHATLAEAAAAALGTSHPMRSSGPASPGPSTATSARNPGTRH